MFTGIVQGKAVVLTVVDKKDFRSIEVELPNNLVADLKIGASVAVGGVCLTVTQICGQSVGFDVVHETLLRTTLGTLEVGSSVNIERSAKRTDEVGGHILSGHIDCVGEIVSRETPENNVLMTCRVPLQYSKYIFSKGYIGLDGASLTINNADSSEGTFQIWLIPETLRVTTFGGSKVGDKLNVEIDRSTQVIVDTVERFLRENSTKN